MEAGKFSGNNELRRTELTKYWLNFCPNPAIFAKKVSKKIIDIRDFLHSRKRGDEAVKCRDAMPEGTHV